MPRSLERERLSQTSRSRAGGGSNTNQVAEGKNSLCATLKLIVFSDTLRLSDLESIYPDFRSVYHRLIQNARFSVALRRDPYFESRKICIVSVRHLLDKHQNLPTETRSELVQALLKGDFYRAQHLLSKADGKKSADSGGWGVGNLFGGSGDYLNREMRVLAGDVSDSQFLLDINGTTDTETRSAIQEIEAVAHAKLASAVDATVKAMTRNVLAMQLDYCTRSIQHEMEGKGRKSLKNALADFIRDVNTQSSRRRDS